MIQISVIVEGREKTYHIGHDLVRRISLVHEDP